MFLVHSDDCNQKRSKKKNIKDYNTPCRSIHKEKKKISPQIQK